ncbi:muramoyltetrapeptide carboxypeptidase [Lipingzhangella halophila]|uniref:Muramoyltetrapeptide carboxypeptidase n=1 Tax=Lipingzhangella halophila TaxID=1783352 RepID=A0A7W7REY6_9ACTN|nr:LD-carboxypeptidase [Lipingzhangella halophila]MBB4930768.1 muramoyltetrapeptide carboxypeptidase [Lipingzhangella halophila]
MSEATTAHRPGRLRPGDRVSVAAPCSPAPPGRLDAALRVLRRWGLEPVLAPHVRDRHPKLRYLAGTDDARAAGLRQAWLDPDTAAVLCARGGDGAHRTLDLLDFAELRRAQRKILVGFSDITALHEAFSRELGVVTLHGPVVASQYFVDDPVAAEELRSTLFEPESRPRLTSPKAEPLIGGTARGVTIGGNLSLLNDGLMAPFSRPSAEGGLVLLEDIGEDISRVDRMLTHLLRSGWLRGAAGVLLGSWTDCPPGPRAVRELMAERLRPLGIPAVWGLNFGHCQGQLTIPLGVRATLDADSATLILDQPALR